MREPECTRPSHVHLSQQVMCRADNANGPTITMLRNEMTSIRQDFVLISCREISAQPRARCTITPG